MSLLLFYGGVGGLLTNSTSVILTLPVNCQLAITNETNADKYTVGNVNQLGERQFKTVFRE